MHSTPVQTSFNRSECIIIVRHFMKNCLFFQSLTNGSGFFLSDSREMVGEGRHVVLRHRETGEFIDDFTNKGKRKIDKQYLPLNRDRNVT